MEISEKEKDLIETVVAGIFNGVPVVTDVCGIEAFNAEDVFTYLRGDGKGFSAYLNEYEISLRNKISGVSDEDLKKAIESVLFSFVKAGVFIHTPGSEYGDFDPTELAYGIRKYFITGETS